MVRYVVAALLLWVAGCAAPPPLPLPSPDIVRCQGLFAALDEGVARYGFAPGYPRPVTGFPYLRVDRFLAGFAGQELSPAAREVWLGRMAELDYRARRVELASLPPWLIQALTRRAGGPPSPALEACAQRWLEWDLAEPARLARLEQAIHIPDAYYTGHRILGLYPLTALMVQRGIADWHRQRREVFATPLVELPLTGQLRRYRPEATSAGPLDELPRDALDVPAPSAAQLEDLFVRYAPVWEVDTTGDYDLPGAPRWGGANRPSVDPARPLVYRYVSYALWRGRPVLQLNYLLWFAARPRSGPFDILGGPLDGLLWRVTLDRRGEVLLYDSIHPCGCYHQFFPGPGLVLKPEARQLPEPPLVPQSAPRLEAGQRVVIRLSSGSHYVQRVYADRPSGAPYSLEDYESLYLTPTPEGRGRPLFSPDGLVAGSQRLERYLFWPMGVPSAGAMRERGHHATAFVGRRHFDDPQLLEHLFRSR
ncbi:MAG: hypothetical protein R3310_01865 [Candidatus Competibacteraceae bacterium]|nr:hypothetical protein [Candidatus Competibacteraceae bacterium]